MLFASTCHRLLLPASLTAQVWLTPDARGHQPQYGSAVYEEADRRNRLLHVLGGTGAAPGWKGIYAAGPPINLHQARPHACCGRVPPCAASSLPLLGAR